MRVNKLNLAAFGPFTDRMLEFSEEGLHIVYGHNEAGKSSALRGLKALLYGIDERTLDNFLHANEKLRIQGHLQTADAQECVFVRRKGRKNTLLDPDGKVLNEQMLTPFLQNVTAEWFETLFGIDHQALVRGGQEILEQKGEVGQALFSAALGSRTLVVRTRLDDEADGLFRPKGSKQTINSAVRSYKDIKKDIRECSLSSSKWVEHRRKLTRTTTELEETKSKLGEKRLEKNRLQRIQRVLPKLARFRERAQELESLHDVVILPEDFANRRQKAVSALGAHQAIVDQSTSRLKGLQEQFEELSINQALLEQAENIEAIHARLGVYRTALQDRPDLEAETRQLLADAKSILKEIRPDIELKGIEKLRPILTKQQIVSDHSGKNTELNGRVENAESNLRKAKRSLEAAHKARDEIPESAPTDALHRAIVAARKRGELDALIQTHQSQLSNLRTECDDSLARLPLWAGELEEVVGLALPNKENIDRFRQDYEKISDRISRLEEKKEELIDSLQNTSRGINEIEGAGEVLTEADLTNARAERDKVWRLLRLQWLDGEAVSARASDYQGEGALPDVFEKRLTISDEVSDRLRREADRVQNLANLQASHEHEQEQSKRVSDQIGTEKTKKDQLDADWQRLWAPCQIDPHTPREMRAWLGDFEELRGRVERLNELRNEADELEQNRREHIRQLNEQLTGLGGTASTSVELETLLLECEVLAKRLNDSRSKRDLLSREAKKQEAEVESSNEEHQLAIGELGTWKGEWRQLMQSLGLNSETSPSEAGVFIEKLRILFSKQDEAEGLQFRIDAMDKEVAAFRKQVGLIVLEVAPKLGDLPEDQACVRLNSLLSENRQEQTRRQQIEEDIEGAKAEIENSNVSIQTVKKKLDALCREAKCDNQDQLVTAETCSAERLRIQEAFASIKREILEAGEGSTIAELEVQAKDSDPDSLPGQIEELTNEIGDDLERRQTDLATRMGSEQTELKRMDGNDQAARFADDAQAVLATIRSGAERYVQVKLAGKILRDQIERYQQENQGPLVKRASEYFATLTLDSFESLNTGFNEKDEPVLIGCRPGGERVKVEGMSSGTRDQLYLALRLASLEKFMESSKPMPFIVDDILVDFDDDRSKAALNVLAKLAKKTQIILFTHHSRLVEQARGVNGPVQVQEL